MRSEPAALLATVFAIAVAAPARPAQAQSSPPPSRRDYVRIDAPVVALTHVRVIDGTGAEPKPDQTVVLDHGKIRSIEPAARAQIPAGAKVLALEGHSVIPGLVGMHDHMFYPSGHRVYAEHAYSFPRLYLAGGVTIIRTTGSLETDTDIALKKKIDEGHLPGPKIHVTGPYLEGVGSPILQNHELAGPDEATKMVNFWADRGATSFKAYMHITRAELKAAIAAAHKRGLKVTGHLCSIGFSEAAALGIDNLEHGLLADSEFAPGKAPDVCPEQNQVTESLLKLDLESAPAQKMIHELVQRRVAVTSTLPVFETSLPGRPPLRQAVLDSMAVPAQIAYLAERARRVSAATAANSTELFKKELAFERAFVKAGGLLLAGLDPTGYGGVVAGFGDQREVELLVEAGFTPLEAIHIATANGAQFLGELDRIGTLQPGKQADLVVLNGDPVAKIADIEKVEIVFKDGIGYDSAKLIELARGSVGMN